MYDYIVGIVTLLFVAACWAAWLYRRDALRARDERAHEAWMHSACLSIAEGAPCRETDAAVTASLATRAVYRLRRDWVHAKDEIGLLRARIAELNALLDKRPAHSAPKPARLQRDGMPQETIAQLLAGTSGIPAIKAVMALVESRIVAASDRATDRPQPLLVTPERTILPYTAEDRLYDSGRASAYAELSAELETMTATQDAAEKGGGE